MGDLARYTITIPVFGYLILFNDTVANLLKFDALTNSAEPLFFTTTARLQFVYFGLLLVALASVWFRTRSPEQTKISSSVSEFQKYALENYSTYQIVLTFLKNNREHHFGNFDDTQFSRDDLVKFLSSAAPNAIALENALYDEFWFYMSEVSEHDVAVRKSREFLMALFEADYIFASHERQLESKAVFLVSGLGFVFLAVPSVEVFVSVVWNLLP